MPMAIHFPEDELPDEELLYQSMRSVSCAWEALRYRLAGLGSRQTMM